MRSRPMIMLYDALVVICPESERFKVRVMMQEHMSDKTTWIIHNRKYRYTIDASFSKRWGEKLTKGENDRLYTEEKIA